MKNPPKIIQDFTKTMEDGLDKVYGQGFGKSIPDINADKMKNNHMPNIVRRV